MFRQKQLLRSTYFLTRSWLLSPKKFIHLNNKHTIDRRIILDFLNIDTFDEKEIEKSYRKYVLDGIKRDDDDIEKININGTRESLKTNVSNKLEKLRVKSQSVLHQHKSKSIGSTGVNHTGRTSKHSYLTTDDIMSLFPLISTSTVHTIPSSSAATTISSPLVSKSSSVAHTANDISDIVIDAKISDINFDTSKQRNSNEVLNNQEDSLALSPLSSTVSGIQQPSPPSLSTVVLEQLVILNQISSLSSSSSNYNVISTQPLDYSTYRHHIRTFGEKLDDRVWTVAGSFLLTGASIGMIIPCMPILVKQLELTSSDFGLVVSCFGLAKLMANIPAGYYVDVVGRKPMLVTGLGMCAVGIGGLGMALSPWVLPLPTLMACRFITGLGVSTFSAGAFMMMNDVSTPLNRTRTMAPVMTGFQAGIALGPAIGGVAIQSLGIPLTYMSCGVLFSIIAAVNHMLLQETLRVKSSSSSNTDETNDKDISRKSSVTATTDQTSSSQIPPHVTSQRDSGRASSNSSTGVFTSFSTAISSWYHLSTTNPSLRQLCLLNLIYWFTLAGVQMTLLPLYMVSPLFNLAPTQIGSAFALMSIFSILSSQPTAYLADGVFGKASSILIGCALVTTSFLTLPFATTYYELLTVLVPLSIGSTVLQSVPTAYVADITPPTDRSQALSLFRTAGDIGLLLGASTTGYVMSHVAAISSINSSSVVSDGGFHTAIHMNAACMMTAMAYFAFRLYQQQRQRSHNKQR